MIYVYFSNVGEFCIIKTIFLYFCLSLIFSGVNLGASSQFSDFLDGLGPAQLVGRQTLATPAIGKILPIKVILFFSLLLSVLFFFFLLSVFL